jgi:hypothetical protein
MTLANSPLVDLDLAAGGYLRAPDGRIRQVPGLNCIARELVAEGIRVRWGTPRTGSAACTYLWSREILLATWLFDLSGEDIRDVWLHELGHCVVGRSCERVRQWQQAWVDEQAESPKLA